MSSASDDHLLHVFKAGDVQTRIYFKLVDSAGLLVHECEFTRID